MKRSLDSEIVEAAVRISTFLSPTPILQSVPLSQRFDATVVLKLENEQVTGSFKARGAMNKMLLLTDEERKKEIRRLARKGPNKSDSLCKLH